MKTTSADQTTILSLLHEAAATAREFPNNTWDDPHKLESEIKRLNHTLAFLKQPTLTTNDFISLQTNTTIQAEQALQKLQQQHTLTLTEFQALEITLLKARTHLQETRQWNHRNQTRWQTAHNWLKSQPITQ